MAWRGIADSPGLGYFTFLRFYIFSCSWVTIFTDFRRALNALLTDSPH
jgi:hypothetical protein